MKEPLISIIVPIYKTEPYLRKCLDSIVQQTYRNLEIILVDDGSPDNCGAICDEYAPQDERIKVIHKPNGGLSSARNAGIAVATGEYIGFVDSDDWIELDMFEYLISNALIHNSDITACSHLKCFPDHQEFCGWNNTLILEMESALVLLLEDETLHNYVWDKLWRSSLFDGISFPEGKTFEDIAVSYQLFLRADKVVLLPEAKYNYLQHSNSIVNDLSFRNRINLFLAQKDRLNNLGPIYPQFVPLMEKKYITTSISIWCSYLNTSKSERHGYDTEIVELSNFIKQNAYMYTGELSLGLAGRIILRLAQYPYFWSFSLARFVSALYKIRHGKDL